MKEIVIRGRKDYEKKLSPNIMVNSFNVYCRVSTKDQIDNTSLDNQMELGVEFVKKNYDSDFKYIVIWREEGKSGDDYDLKDDGMGEMVKRELLNILIDSWKKRLIKNIWVYDLSRLSRNENTSNLLKSIIYKNGIDLYLNNQKYDFDNQMDRLLFGVLSLVNEFENHQRFEKGLMGKRKNLEIGKWWGGTVPMGFKTEDGFLIEDKDRSSIVKKMFYWYGTKGLSTTKIKERLEKLNVKTQRGQKVWNSNSIRNILTNTSYIGYIDYEVKGLKGKSKEYCRERGLLTKHRFKCEGFIDKKEWEFVNTLLGQRKRVKKNTNNHKFLLKDVLYCESCGFKMRGRYYEKTYENLYKCYTNEENWRNSRIEKCGKTKSVNRVGLEELVWVKILEVFKNSEIIRETFRKENLPKEYDLENTKKRILSNNKKIKLRIKRLEKIEDNRIDNISKHSILKISKKQLETILGVIDVEMEKIKNEIEGLKLKNDLLKNSNVWEEWFSSFKLHFNKICNYKSFDDKRKFITDYVEKIYVSHNKDDKTHNIKIQFKLNIVRDKGDKIGKDIYKIKKGKDSIQIKGIDLIDVKKKIKKKKGENTNFLDYSTVTDWVKQLVFLNNTPYINKYNSLILNFTLSFKSSKLTSTSHYTDYQKGLFEEIKRLKEVENLGYRRISYLLYEKGYRSVRTNSVLRNNYIHSIYKKGKIRENRINREFDNIISDILVYEDMY